MDELSSLSIDPLQLHTLNLTLIRLLLFDEKPIIASFYVIGSSRLHTNDNHSQKGYFCSNHSQKGYFCSNHFLYQKYERSNKNLYSWPYHSKYSSRTMACVINWVALWASVSFDQIAHVCTFFVFSFYLTKCCTLSLFNSGCCKNK